MVNTVSWPIRTVEIVSLSLDTENVRLRSVQPYEAEILAYLYEYEDALGLATEIVQDGLFDHDLPIVAREGKKLIVLEGNRRISALKGLANPTIVPRYKKQLAQLRKSLSKKALEELQKVRVMEAPDRDSAKPILASLHTRNPKRSWPLDQQAAFYFSQLGPKITVKDLQVRYPSVAAKIPRFIRMAEMYELVRKSNLGEATLKEFVESKQFKMSVYERLYASDEFIAKIGVGFMNDGHIKVTGKKADRDRILAQVVRDIKVGILDTRRLGRQGSKEFKEYLGILGLSPASPPKTIGKPAQTALAGAASTGSKLKKKATLDTTDIDFGLTCYGLEQRFAELTTINPVIHPNSAMDLLRTILECSLKQYFIEAKDPIVADAGKPIMLSTALAHAHDRFKKNKGLSSIIASLRNSKPQSEVQYSKSSDALNAVNHNPDVFFGPNEVRETWEHARPLIKVLLAGVPTSSPTKP